MENFKAAEEGSDSGADESETFMKILNNLSLTQTEIEQLPGEWYKLYEELLQERRKKQLEGEDLLVKNIKKKLLSKKQLDYSEESLLENRSLKVSSIQSSHVNVNAVDLLNDIVNGDYSLQDVHSIREGPEAAEDKDAVENSPLQLFDIVIDSVKEQTHEALQTKQPGNFFGSLEDELTSGRIKPSQLEDAINHAATAIDLVQGKNFVDNEAQEALNDYIKALAMNEAEVKLKQLDEMANESQAREEASEKFAEVAAASGLLSDDTDPGASTKAAQDHHKSFEVTELNYDVSYLPSDDPNVYKPLEIISYIGLTKNVS